MITINVSGGSGSASFDFGVAHFDSVSIVSPDNTPMYDFQITDPDGHMQIAGASIDSQRCVIKENFTLRGDCTISISSAVDDGIYTVKLNPR